MRTTVDLDPQILAELKRRSRAEHKTLGQLASELLAPALKDAGPAETDFVWGSEALGAFTIDIADNAAVQALLDAEEVESHP